VFTACNKVGSFLRKSVGSLVDSLEVTGSSASGAKLPMNLSAEADAAFMRELQREDSQGYDRLMKNIQTAAIRSGRSIEYRSHQAASMRAKAEGL
jgi:hypothetical protein